MRTINLASRTAEAKFNRFHLSILLWCALIIVMDGYDLAVAGIALPSIMQAMSIEPAHAGLMVSSALFGMLFGNLLFGTLGERIGRPKRSEEHTSELQSLMRISYAVFCLKKKTLHVIQRHKGATRILKTQQ